MKTILIAAVTFCLAQSALAINGYVCESERNSNRMEITLLDDSTARVFENDTRTLDADYRRDVYSEEPLMAFAKFDLEDGRTFDIVESDFDTKAIFLGDNYQLEIYKCETLD